jgi:hypothetical protein
LAYLCAAHKPGSTCIRATTGSNECDTITFTIVEPSGMTVSFVRDNYIGLQGPPNNYIGCSSYFKCVVEPASVNFHYAVFQENIPGETWTWPNGTYGYWPSNQIPWYVDDVDSQNNVQFDTCSEYFAPVSVLWNGLNYVDHCHIVRVPEEYLNQDGQWIPWLPNETHPVQYNGLNQKANVSIEASNIAFGSWMGPWQ